MSTVPSRQDYCIECLSLKIYKKLLQLLTISLLTQNNTPRETNLNLSTLPISNPHSTTQIQLVFVNIGRVGRNTILTMYFYRRYTFNKNQGISRKDNKLSFELDCLPCLQRICQPHLVHFITSAAVVSHVGCRTELAICTSTPPPRRCRHSNNWLQCLARQDHDLLQSLHWQETDLIISLVPVSAVSKNDKLSLRQHTPLAANLRRLSQQRTTPKNQILSAFEKHLYKGYKSSIKRRRCDRMEIKHEHCGTSIQTTKYTLNPGLVKKKIRENAPLIKHQQVAVYEETNGRQRRHAKKTKDTKKKQTSTCALLSLLDSDAIPFTCDCIDAQEFRIMMNAHLRHFSTTNFHQRSFSGRNFTYTTSSLRSFKFLTLSVPHHSTKVGVQSVPILRMQAE